MRGTVTAGESLERAHGQQGPCQLYVQAARDSSTGIPYLVGVELDAAGLSYETVAVWLGALEKVAKGDESVLRRPTLNCVPNREIP